MEEDIKKALETLRNGGVIIYPTDTIWGIGCDATNEKAVEKVFDIKGRAESKSVILLVDDIPALERVVGQLPMAAEQIVEAAVEPMTIIYDHGSGVAPQCLAEDGSVGVRITHEDFSKRLCQLFRKPIVSTSANKSGEPSPASFAEIPAELLEAADYVVKYRQNDLEPHKSSSIIKVSDDNVIKIIR